MNIVAAEHAAMRGSAESTAPAPDPASNAAVALIVGLAATAGLGLFAARKKRPG